MAAATRRRSGISTTKNFSDIKNSDLSDDKPGRRRVKVSGLVPEDIDREFRRLIPLYFQDRKRDPVSAGVTEAIANWIKEKKQHENKQKNKIKKKNQ
jgi:hypothetical protein